MLYATGLQPADMEKPQVGIASVWFEGNPCNMHLLALAEKVKEGVTAAGLVGMRFNTIGVSDGISMGTERHELLAAVARPDRRFDRDRDVRPVVRRQHLHSGLRQEYARLHHRHGRLNRPSLMIYGGTIRAGHSGGKKLDVISAFQSYGEFLSGNIDEEQRQEIVRHSCPGAGACGGMYTANTMASAIEALGMSLPYSSSTPAEDPLKLEECLRSGAAIRNLLELDLKPRDIMTREAFENAMVLVSVLGGSTNAVLHLIAMARAVDVPLTIDDFQAVSDRAPLLADFKPSGQYVMEDLQAVGGIPAVMKMLLEEGLLNGDCLTVTGQTVRGKPEGSAGSDGGPGDRAAAVESPEGDRPHSDPARQSGAGGRGRQDHRQRRAALLRSGQSLRFRRGYAGGAGRERNRQRRRDRDSL